MPSNQLLSSKIVFEEVSPSGRAVPKFNTCVVAFEGVTEKGPVGVATLLLGFDDYKRIFGGYIEDSDLTSCVEGFFLTGGVLCWVTRVVHYTDLTDATTKKSDSASVTLSTEALVALSASVTSGNAGTYEVVNGQTVVVVVDANQAVTGTVSAISAAITAGATQGQGLVLADGETLTVKIDRWGPQTITFHTSNFADITAATYAEVAAVIAAGLPRTTVDLNGGKVRITSDCKGSGSKVQVTGGTANAVLEFNTDEVTVSGNVSDASAATAAEFATIIQTAVGSTASVSVTGGKVKITSATTGADSHVQVTSGSTAVALGFDNATHTGQTAGTLDTLLVEGKYDGTYGNGLSVQKGTATSKATDQFNLYVLDAVTSIRKETFPNLSMDSTNPRYVETVINNSKTGSTLIKVTDLGAATSATNAIPAAATSRLVGGLDGLSGTDGGSWAIGDDDYVGNPAGWTGLYAFDKVSSLTVLAVCGIATPAVHTGMVAYCETHRSGQIFPILDPPANLDAAGMITYVETTAALENLSEFGAIYWPRIKVANPSQTLYGVNGEDGEGNIVIPPSGDICGVLARTDNAREGGVWTQPAGTETGKFSRVLGFETDDVLSEDVRDLVFPHRINPLTVEEGFPRYIDGARTLKGDGNFPSIGQRRGVSYCERTVKAALQPERHQNNNGDTRAVVQRSVWAFLKTQCDLGAFASKIPDQAFFVDFGDGLQVSPNIIDGMWGVATTQPAEFIRMKVSQDMRAANAANS
jgi:hypothetical protein